MGRARLFAAGLTLAAAALAGGCSSEQRELSLAVTAAPNPVSGVNDPDGRRWDFSITIANPNAVGVFIEYYHHEISDTDTGYSQPLLPEDKSPVVGTRIPSGASLTYPANRYSEGRFSRGTERRIYHTRGDDGRYYSGEVLVRLE